MLKNRIIPILTFNGFALVKTKQFGSSPRMVGNPAQSARVFNSRGVDELAFVDIFASRQSRKINQRIVGDVLKECFMPTSVGGNIDTLVDIESMLEIGADKVILQHAALEQPDFLAASARVFGEQALSVALDVFPVAGGYKVRQGDTDDRQGSPDLAIWLQRLSNAGAGEFIITAIDHDGMMQGYDLSLGRLAADATNKPVVLSGGAGDPSHFLDLFQGTGIRAAAAASMFYFTRHTPQDVKVCLDTAGIPVRLRKRE